jgi:hypothetical protein
MIWARLLAAAVIALAGCARPASRAADDAAYVAMRRAEQARLEARCEAALEALHRAQRQYAQAARSLEEARGRREQEQARSQTSRGH